MMRLSLVLVGLLLIALSQALPTRSHSRQKRGFRSGSGNRVAHGYGKRQFDSWEDNSLKSESSSDLLTARQLAELTAENPTLTEALIRKFVDVNGDGVITSMELFGLPLQQ